MLILIEQTNHCSLQCISCPNRLYQRPKGVMPAENFRKIIDQLEHLKNERMALHGFGDVFLNPDFFENLAYLDSKGFRRVDFSSNGLLLTEKIIKELNKFDCLNFVAISLNSSVKERMKKINTGSDFEFVVENTRTLIASKPKFSVHIQHMIYKDTEMETREDFIRLLDSEDFIFCQKNLHDFYGQVKDGLSNTKQIDCLGGFAALPMMHWDGDLVGCCGDDTKLQVYGNVLRDGIFSPKTMQRRQELIQDLANKDYIRLPLCGVCYG